jgi:hypothetical protein
MIMETGWPLDLKSDGRMGLAGDHGPDHDREWV